MKISIQKYSNQTLEQLAFQHDCNGNLPNDNCYICNEMARRGLIPTQEEQDLQLAYEMGANPYSY